MSSQMALRNNKILYAALLTALLSIVLLVSSLLLPTLISSQYYQKSLKRLRIQAHLIKNEFLQVQEDLRKKQKYMAVSPLPKTPGQIFGLFQHIIQTPDVEGVALYDSEGTLSLWLGNVIDVADLLHQSQETPLVFEQKSPLLIQNKASFYLVSAQKFPGGAWLVFYRLLAFRPQLKSPYLQNYSFLKSRLRKNCEISYWDYREDVSGFEKIFSRHKDEYIGQPRLQREVQSIFFPLRNEQKEIIATVSLQSPSLSGYISSQKESPLLVFYLLLGTSLIFLIIFLAREFFSARGQKFLPGLFLLLALIGLRLIFFPLENLEKIQSQRVFSPALAGFLSLWNLTQSPADIFLTSLIFFLIIGLLAFSVLKRPPRLKKNPPYLFSLFFSLVFAAISVYLLFIFERLVSRLIFNSNVNLLRFSFHLPFLSLHLSIIFSFLGVLLVIYMGMKIIAHFSPRLIIPFLTFLAGFSLCVFYLMEDGTLLEFILRLGILAFLSLAAFFSGILKRKECVFLFLVLTTVWIYGRLHGDTTERMHSLIQSSLQSTVTSQAHWANFFLKESFPAVEKQGMLLSAFFQNLGATPDFARFLWEKTLLAKFNWYSSLEILNSEGEILSHFSLNIPRLFLPLMSLPRSLSWKILPLTVPFLGKEKELIIGYKDWLEGETHLGRTIFYLSVDYDMLPFLYSANPYFELLRVHSVPSLNQFDFGFAIFNDRGKFIFNPQKISTGLSPDILQRFPFASQPVWSTFSDKRKTYEALYFGLNNRIYALFMPRKNFITHSIAFLKLFFFYVFVLAAPSSLLWLTFSRKKFKHLFWSFSNRVYISFIAVALIPLFLFTFFTRNFFSRIFSQQFVEKAEIHANMARSVMDDFFFFQEEEKTEVITLPEDLVLWISTTISNDVNLFHEGKLVSSSRREFFDSGLLPELLDGEIYYKIQYENTPFYAKTRKIGNFSFRTLTIPYTSFRSPLLISLPFPLEQQEISQATADLIEFLFFISIFFIATVLALARGIGTMIITPIQKLLAGTKEASLGNLEIAIDYKSKDEMKTLINGFNAMIKNLKKHQQELAEMSKKVAWAEMARKVAHEVKNPLTPIQLSAEHILRVYEDKKGNFDQALKESVSYIISEVENLRKIAQEFLEISKETVLQKEFFDFRGLIKETIDPYKKMLAERIQFKESYQGEDFRYEGDRSKIKIALRNLLTNAIESVRGKGEIRIHLAQAKSELTIRLEDTGVGIETDIIERIFEPYFSTKDVGTGLGLPIVKKIVEDHKGTIRIDSRPKKGTSITIHLPLIKNIKK
ncbi:MAG: ATP-binding protein [Candidatus Aminicenantales bacterium]